MRELFKTRIDGRILYGSEALRCPKCRAERGLVVYGYRSGKARIECPRGHEFAVPKPFDAKRLMEQTAKGPGRRVDSLAYSSQMPDPDLFR